MKTLKTMTASALLASCVATSMVGVASARSSGVELFGHLGVAYNHALGDNRKGADGKDVGFMGATGHFGADFGSEEFGAGLGVWAGSQVFSLSKDAGKSKYGSEYYDVSDLYFRYTGAFDLYVGRFSSSFLKSDWIDLYTQGVGLSIDFGKDSNFWASWANDSATFGVLPNRIGSELMAYSRFPSSFDNFNIGKKDFVGAGANIGLGIFHIDPFAHYYINNYNNNQDTIQAGARLAIIAGDKSTIESTTSVRGMYQYNKQNSYLVWAEEELFFAKYFKLGGGYYMVGKDASIYSNSDHTRFYGRYTTPSTASYFAAGASSWYGFAGVEHERVKFDVLYAGGDYKEFSAVVSVRVLDLKLGIMREGFGIDVGAGYVSNGFDSTYQRHNAIAFAKLVF